MAQHDANLGVIGPSNSGKLAGKPSYRLTSIDVSRVVGKNLREARKSQGYSLESLAKASGVSRAMLGQIETGKSVPTVTVIWRVADALGVPIDKLVVKPVSEAGYVLTRDKSLSRSDRNGGFASRVLALPQIQEAPRFVEMNRPGFVGGSNS